jgi:hypothetical protein
MTSQGISSLLSLEERRQRAVLDLHLDEHPAHLAIDEVVRALASEPDDFAAVDDLHNAIGELVAYGLVHRHDRFVFASRAAMRLWQLDPQDASRALRSLRGAGAPRHQ